MLEILRRALWDEAYFAQWARMFFAGIFAVYEMGLVPEALDNTFLWYCSKVAIIIAVFIRAGDKNDTVPSLPLADPALRVPMPPTRVHP